MEELNKLVRNTILDQLACGNIALTMSAKLIDSVEIVPIIKSVGFDGFYIDLEHSSLDISAVGQIAVTALGYGISCIVRVPSNDGPLISRVLDAGAMGVHVPHVENEDDAKNAVQYAKFPPLGSRSVSPTLPQLGYRTWPLEESRKAVNKATIIVAIIESKKGVDHADEIAAVDGIDVLLVGTNDLCADWNIHGQFDDPKVEVAYEKVMSACKAHGKVMGIGGLAARPDLVAKYVALGARYVMAGSDLQFFVKGAQDRMAQLQACR